MLRLVAATMVTGGVLGCDYAGTPTDATWQTDSDDAVSLKSQEHDGLSKELSEVTFKESTSDSQTDIMVTTTATAESDDVPTYTIDVDDNNVLTLKSVNGEESGEESGSRRSLPSMTAAAVSCLALGVNGGDSNLLQAACMLSMAGTASVVAAANNATCADWDVTVEVLFPKTGSALSFGNMSSVYTVDSDGVAVTCPAGYEFVTTKCVEVVVTSAPTDGPTITASAEPSADGTTMSPTGAPTPEPSAAPTPPTPPVNHALVETGATAYAGNSKTSTSTKCCAPEFVMNDGGGYRWSSLTRGIVNETLWIEFDTVKTFDTVYLEEFLTSGKDPAVTGYNLQAWDGAAFNIIHTGTTRITSGGIWISFTPVQASKILLEFTAECDPDNLTVPTNECPLNVAIEDFEVWSSSPNLS